MFRNHLKAVLWSAQKSDAVVSLMMVVVLFLWILMISWVWCHGVHDFDVEKLLKERCGLDYGRYIEGKSYGELVSVGGSENSSGVQQESTQNNISTTNGTLPSNNSQLPTLSQLIAEAIQAG